jgi:hypothetical protein
MRGLFEQAKNWRSSAIAVPMVSRRSLSRAASSLYPRTTASAYVPLPQRVLLQDGHAYSEVTSMWSPGGDMRHRSSISAPGAGATLCVEHGCRRMHATWNHCSHVTQPIMREQSSAYVRRHTQ